ncbi:tetratricopeptide repeat protein [Bdellovibrio svalbardensis]|uniref:Tetratricopeptide repeat protein n=1 Tax=Bdellovibrio svalbardensis TaxID=2972972 RepID=A0ABT6DDF4_9BACT|nr:tetratricopeptide repeat protein [Bdellovibrio svalbardensis]MDG0814853.1 tetratricopeptide repeat protein [Bdellovibrio svalbardensis]
MSRIQVTWVVKTKTGQVKGPYSTEAILRMIGEGVFSGQEMISKLPDGQWTLISKETAFYDKLLEALEGVVEVDPKKAHKMEAETVIMRPPPSPSRNTQNTNTEAKPKLPSFENLGSSQPQNGKFPAIDLYQAPAQVAPATIPIPNVSSNESKDSVIELSNLKNMEKGEMLSAMRGPIVILLVVALVGFFLLWDTGPAKGDKIHLLAPGKASAPLSETQVRDKLNESLFAIEQDTFDSYLEAQNKLVTIVEGSPTNIEVRALLCMVYRELWPYAKQDAQDVRTIAMVTQATRALNVVSPLGQVCESVKLLTSGRYREARGTVEGILESTEPFSLLPVLYGYKAELLEGEKDLVNAVPYYEKAIQLWDKWLHPQVQLANLYYEQQKFSDASRILQDVLKRNPKHREAKLLLGVVEYRGFKKSDTAFTLLSAAVDSKVRVPPLSEAQGLHALAEIYVFRNEKKKALEFAQRAFSLNPNNNDLRQLVVRLGGSDKVKNDKSQNNELLFLGDQYVRQGDFLAAQAEFKAAFEMDPKSGTAAMKAAKCLWQLNQSFEAIEWLGKAMRAEPKLVSAYVLQADYMSQRYDFAGAMAALTNATRIAPNNYEVLRGLALMEFRKNNMGGAVNYATRAVKVYDGDIETFILLSKANGVLAQSIMPLNKKEIERKENAAKDAVRYATKAVEIDATNPEAQITYAKTLAATNGVDSGITYLNELIKRFSYTLDYRVALAEVYKSEDRYTQARDIYEKVVEVDPRNKKAWLGLGESSKAIGLNDKALKAFLQAAVLDPTDGEALFQAGKLYFETGRFEEAIQQFRRVQRLNPNYPRTNYYIGKAAFSSGDLNGAMEATKAEKRLNPNLADSYILAAEIFTTRRQYQECAGEYSQAMKLRPQGAEIYVKAAQCYRQSGSLDVAEDMLALAAARESGYADIYREQGAIYETKGDARSAATAYNKYIGLSPNAPDRAEIEARIGRLGN